MKKRSLMFSKAGPLVAGALMVMLSASASAQESAAPSPADEQINTDEATEPTRAPTESESAPAASMEGLADAWTAEMEAKYNESLTMLAAARDAKDPIRQTCISDKVSLMKGVLRVATDAGATLKEKLAINEAELARNQLKKIEQNRSKMDEQFESAKNCAGAESSVVGKASVEVTTTEDLEQPNSYYEDTSQFAQPEVREAAGSTDPTGDDSSGSTPDPLPTVSLATESP
jgi:hypothetical protein